MWYVGGDEYGGCTESVCRQVGEGDTALSHVEGEMMSMVVTQPLWDGERREKYATATGVGSGGRDRDRIRVRVRVRVRVFRDNT